LTAVCGGGASEPRPNVNTLIYLGVQALVALATARVGGWAAVFAAFLPPISLDAGDFCAVDPPAVPTMTATDWLAILAPIHPDKVSAVAKLQDLVLHYAWYEFCQCSTTTTPSFPAPLPAPSDLPTSPVGSLPAGPCGAFEGSGSAPAASCRVGLIGQQGFVGGSGCPATTLTLFPVPSGAVSWQINWDLGGSFTGFQTVAPRISFYNASNVSVGGTIPPGVIQGPSTFTGGIPAGGTQFFLDTAGPDGVNWSVQARVEFFCATSGSTATACCPPDPIATGMLQQILQAVLDVQSNVDLLGDTVDLLQRQIAPFAFTDGTLHAGLTGEGEVTFTTTIVGVRIQVIDSLEGTVGVAAGHPETLYGLGWFRWGNGVYWRDREFIDAETMLSTPYAASSCTKLAYSLPPGAEIDVRELWREPL
jgi:hypothetical protein